MINKKLLKKLDEMSKSDLIFICRKLGFAISGNKSKKQLVSILLKPLKRKYKMKNYFPIWNLRLKNVNGCVKCLEKLQSELLLASTSNDMAFGKNLDDIKLYQLTENDLVNLKRECDTCHNNLKRLEYSRVKADLTRFFRIMNDTYDDKRNKNLERLKIDSDKRTRKKEEKHMETIQKLEEETRQLELLTALKKFEIPPVTDDELENLLQQLG